MPVSSFAVGFALAAVVLDLDLKKMLRGAR
jgi:hypothetical protein